MSGPSPAFRRVRTVVALLSAAAGGAVTTITLMALNGELAPPPRDDQGTAVVVQVVPPKPPPAKPKPKPKPKKRAERPPPPMPALSAGLGGMDFGIPGLAGALDQATEALLGELGDVVMTEDAVDAAPRPLRTVPPEYPPRARREHVTGQVVLSLLIGADGGVQDARVLESEPPGVFEEAALTAVRQWRFQPATYEGRPVSIRARQPLVFELE